MIETSEAPAGAADGPAAERWWRTVAQAVERHRGRAIALTTLVVGLPLLVAAVALRTPTWHPVLDLAMTELRVRDVFGRHTPLIGLPGRIGEYPAQGSHPGPLSFYLLAPTYRALGSSTWALQAGTVLIHVAAIATALWIGARRLGWKGLAVVAALLAVAVRGYGDLQLTQPWNPNLPLLAWLVVLLGTWAVLCRDHRMFIPLVVAASYCAQTHVPYLLLGIGMVLLAAGGMAWQARGLADRGPLVRSVAWGVAAGAVLWLPPFADQVAHEPGNIRTLIDHFGSPPEAPLGVADGVRLALRHLDVWAGIDGFVADGSVWRGLVVAGVWVVAAAVTWRAASRSLRALHVVVAAGLVLGTASMARIFGRPWYYLTLWAWGVTALLVGAVLWSAVAWWRRRTSSEPAPGVAAVAAVFAVVVSLASAVTFADAVPPEQRLSDAVGSLGAQTYDAVVAGTGVAPGADGRYLVRWSDAADIGSPGFGLLDDLERRGLDVAADPFFRVQVTGHRTREAAANDAQLHLATGAYVERWRAVAGAVEVATYDVRTDAERAEFEDVRRRFVERLAAEGLGELAPLVDTNLFGISVDTRLSAADHADLARLIELGQPMSVFIAAPDADDAPGSL